MSIHFGDLRKEFGPMLRLATPLAMAELGWMTMGIADTLMAGPLGAAAVGAGSLGNMVFYPTVTAGLGLIIGMDTLVAQAFGAQDLQDCRRTLVNGIWLAAFLSPPLMLLILAILPLLQAAGTNPAVMELCGPYMRALLWGILPLLFYTALRRYLQAINIVKPVTFALVSANVVNVVGDWVLMYGHWGFRPMGLPGSGWSTSISRVYMGAVLLATILWHERKTGNLVFLISWWPDAARIRRLMSLGSAVAGQIALEGAVFGIVTVLAARLDVISLAAHSLAVQVIATTFMVPLGISSAAAVRVGHAVGRKDPRGVAAAGYAALFIGSLFMGAAGIALWVAPRWIVHLFIRDAAVIASGAVLLRIAAFFELFDGLQIVVTGALRGLGDTRTAMIVHFIGYWVIGMPIVYILCFRYGWGAPGIWVGLTVALIVIGVVLVYAWRRELRKPWGIDGPK